MTTTTYELLKVGKWIILTCPTCGLQMELTDLQYEGLDKVLCRSSLCDFEVTEDFSKHKVHVV